MRLRVWCLSLLLGTVLPMCAEQSPERLSLSNFNAVRDYVVGDTKNPEYFKIDWQKNVFDGVNEARAQDKPILLWLYFGGPLGNC